MKPSVFKLHAQLSTLTAMVIFIAATASHGAIGSIEAGTIVYASVLMLIYASLHKIGQAVPPQPQSNKPNIPTVRDIDLSPIAYLKFAFVPLLWALDMAFLIHDHRRRRGQTH